MGEIDQVSFHLDLQERSSHLVKITMEFVAPCDNPVLEMPSWTPGSYLIRDFARHVQELHGRDSEGKLVNIEKVKKNNWKVQVNKGMKTSISYKVYCYELSVRTNYLDNQIGLLNGTATFFYVCTTPDMYPLKDWKVTLSIDPLDFNVVTSLKSSEGVYFADDFDELFDSPIGFAIDECFDSVNYTIEGIPCQVAIFGFRGNHDILKLKDDLQKMQEASIKLFGELPYDRYIWMLYLVDQGGGGLEHKFCNVSIAPRWNFRKKSDYLKVLRLESHEHFHVYNVKRIRPKQLGPFDYANEVYTTALWVAEGLTNFYEKKIMLYAGLYSFEDYIKEIENAIKQYYETPGRKIRSVAESSFDAWIKLYKPDENTVNSVISYYLKGGLVGLLLDIEIRRQTGWSKSLDDVFRHLYHNFKSDPSQGYDEFQLPSIIQSATGSNVKIFFEKYVYGTEELPFEDYLKDLGIELKFEKVPTKSFTGILFESGTYVIKTILSGSPGIEAGLSPKDEIVSVDGHKISEKVLEEVIQSNDENVPLDITFFHLGKEQRSTIRNVKWREELKLSTLEPLEDGLADRVKQFCHP